MATFGMKYAVFAKIATEPATTAPTYNTGVVIGKAMDAEIKANFNEASLYGDDAPAEYVKELKDVDVTLGVTTIPGEAATALFGSTLTAKTDSDGEKVSYKDTDTASYGGLGFIARESIDNVVGYMLVWLPKVKFAPSDNKFQTKGDSITFQNESISGKAVRCNSGEWKNIEHYSTEAAAIAALNTKAGITE
jgi:phi13 family phage major tail protein